MGAIKAWAAVFSKVHEGPMSSAVQFEIVKGSGH
jgi:hypothetical protein